MKKKFFLILTAMIAICLSACSQNGKNKENKGTKALVVYFSATGTTRQAAQRLAKIAGASLCEIQPQQPYTSADLDWNNERSRSSVEMKDKKSRPAIKELQADIADYDVIYVGFPIWWDTCPTIINTFMESGDFKGKTVIPFATSGGSSVTKAYNDLNTSYPEANWKPGLLLNNVSDDDISKWIHQ